MEVWDIFDLPEGHKPIGCKWVYKIKRKPDGIVDKYKARLVAKGFNQVEGLDYFKSFSTVANSVTVRVLLALAAGKAWIFHQIDINNVFLHGYLDEEIYMTLPEGYKEDQKHRKGEVQLILTVYVNDILITGTLESVILEVKSFLHKEFSIKDLGIAKYFLGIKIARSTNEMFLTQQKYIRDKIANMKMEKASVVATPLLHDWHAHNDDSPLIINSSVYRRLHPTDNNWRATLHVVRYLKGTIRHGLFYSTHQDGSRLKSYCDSDWKKCPLTRKSVTGYCVLLDSALVF
ncbi:transmembrane signal receptor [Lithospermum erythrorhizon]|uniref:Transmembrane signal receptor n=1 Tax=Lithospermum erythrorhizon TaxID=34254 RepID=A0AAV3NYN4_LITER